MYASFSYSVYKYIYELQIQFIYAPTISLDNRYKHLNIARALPKLNY
jgi:hypothetical protein